MTDADIRADERREDIIASTIAELAADFGEPLDIKAENARHRRARLAESLERLAWNATLATGDDR